MHDHDGEERGIKPRKRAVEPGNQSPRTRKKYITCIVDLPRLPVPPIDENLIAVLRLDGLRVVYLAVLEVREGTALVGAAGLLLAELVLLAVGRVPDVVDAEIGDGEECDEPRRPVVFRGVVHGNVHDGVAVGEGNAGHVPKDEHETEFLVVHVPKGGLDLGSWNEGVRT